MTRFAAFATEMSTVPLQQSSLPDGNDLVGDGHPHDGQCDEGFKRPNKRIKTVIEAEDDF
jgi:hypothetical protein